MTTLMHLVERFEAMKWFDNQGIAKSLVSKLEEGQLNAFINHVNAQNGKHITNEAAGYLLRDARYLLDHCR
jgi:hypothetical protein